MVSFLTAGGNAAYVLANDAAARYGGAILFAVLAILKSVRGRTEPA